MARLAAVLTLLSGLIGAAAVPANATDRLAEAQPATGAKGGDRMGDRMIVCGRSRVCWTTRPGCRLVLGPLPRDNRIVCQRPRAS